MTKTRMTRQRQIILEALREMSTHPTADEIYVRVRPYMPHISLGTVYRNLDILAESGKIARLDSCGSMRRFDGRTEPHRHIRCEVCGRMADVFGESDIYDSLPAVNIPGFIVHSVRVEYSGLCEECARRIDEENGRKDE